MVNFGMRRKWAFFPLCTIKYQLFVYNSFDSITQPLQMREQWDYNNRLWQTRIRTISKELQKHTEGVQYTVFEFMQTMMDYIEDTFEMVMIPPTPGNLTDPMFHQSRHVIPMTNTVCFEIITCFIHICL